MPWSRVMNARVRHCKFRLRAKSALPRFPLRTGYCVLFRSNNCTRSISEVYLKVTFLKSRRLCGGGSSNGSVERNTCLDEACVDRP